MAGVTLEVVYRDWLKTAAGVKKSTLAAYDVVWRLQLADLHKRHVRDIKYRDYAVIAKRLSDRATTLRQTVSLARNLHVHAIRNEWSESNPAAVVEFPPVAVRYRPVDLDTARGVLAGASVFRNERFGMYVRTLLLTGARRNEVEKLHYSALSSEGVFHTDAKDSKTGAPHFLVVPLDVAEFLRREGGSPFKEFTGFRGNYYWAHLCKDLGIKDLHLHDLRKAFSAAATNEMDARTASTLLNHQSKITDTVYSQQTMTARIAASRQVASAVIG